MPERPAHRAVRKERELLLAFVSFVQGSEPEGLALESIETFLRDRWQQFYIPPEA